LHANLDIEEVINKSWFQIIIEKHTADYKNQIDPRVAKTSERLLLVARLNNISEG
jgi:hypothetical protein